MDSETGEQLDGIAWVPSEKPKAFKENWVVMFQESLERIALMDLSKSAHRVFTFILSKMAYGNYAMLSQAEMASKLKINKAGVSRAVKELKEQGILVTTDKTPGNALAYRINSHHAWKGTKTEFAKVRPMDARI